MQYMVSKYWKVAIFNDYECSYGKSRVIILRHRLPHPYLLRQR